MRAPTRAGAVGHDEWTAARVANELDAGHISRVAAALAVGEEALGGLEGEAWAAGHVAVLLGRANLYDAIARSTGGDPGAAEAALGRVETALRSDAGDADLESTDGVVAGVVHGHPYLGNDRVVFVWSRPGDGAGLLSIHDRRTQRKFLRVSPAPADLWRISVKTKRGDGEDEKNGDKEATYTNAQASCDVTVEGRGLEFAWQGAIDTRLRATLDPDQTVVRLRLSAAPFSFGRDPKQYKAYGWGNRNSDGKPHPVAQLKPNAWGLHDMHGNVWEWCLDDFVDGATLPADGSDRRADRMTKVVRGGSWSTATQTDRGGLKYPATADSRFSSAPANALNDLGFRVVLHLEAAPGSDGAKS